MKNVIITGVAGLIGARLAEWILQNKSDYNVIGINDLSGGYVENNKQIRIHSIENIFEEFQPEYVFFILQLMLLNV